MGHPAVEVDCLVKRYRRRVAVDELSLRAEAGAITAIVGPNGAGKTTTLECCEGYRRPDSGRVRVLGLDPARQRRRLRTRIGVLLQTGGVFGGATATEMLHHAASMYSSPLPPSALVERLELDRFLRVPYRRLSGGEQRRVGLALALTGRPELVFLDEPTSGLDPHGKHAVWRLLEEIRDQGVSIVVTTHAMDEVERLADQVFVVERGRILAAGTPADLLGRAAASTLTFRGPDDLDLAALQAALPDGSVVEQITSGRYRVAGAFDPQLLTTVTTWCARAGIVPKDLVVARRSLEDVYLDFTGAAR